MNKQVGNRLTVTGYVLMVVEWEGTWGMGEKVVGFRVGCYRIGHGEMKCSLGNTGSNIVIITVCMVSDGYQVYWVLTL